MHLDIPRRWRGTSCLQPSSAGSHASRLRPACGSQGRSARAWSRCPSGSTGPSRPGHRSRNGRHTPAAQTLSTHHSRLVISLPRIPHISARLDSKSALWRYLFCLQSLLCPALRRRLQNETVSVILNGWPVDQGWTHNKIKERTDFVHPFHMVHIVSLPQVEGQLSQRGSKFT